MANNNKHPKKVAIIMAGGFGARFWPRSTDKNPKQFIHLYGEGTMIQNTFTRLLKIFPKEDIYIVTSKAWGKLVQEQLTEIPKENIILEPFGRNTAPCLALAAMILASKYGPDTIIAAFPSDHIIFNIREFCESVELGCKTADELNGIITIGINPTRPEKSFGYVQVRKDTGKLGELYEKGVRYSSNFAEKPDVATAQRFIDSGDFLWNSGIFISKIDVFAEAMEKYWPEDYALFKLLSDYIDGDYFQENVEQTYRQITSLSVDYAILEKADNVFVVQSSFRWSDIGNWDEQFRLSMKDARNNVIEGDVIPINTSNCLVSSHNKLIGIVGVSDLIIIDSDEALLICKRGHSDEVMEVVDFLRRKHINKFL
jgi:mannose-1-phosphate guanylyltransferase